MKKTTLFCIGVIVALAAPAGRAQSTRYTKTLDDPAQAINFMLNVAPISVTFASGKYSPTALQFGVGGTYGIASRLGVEASAGVPYFSTKMEGGPAFIEGGAFLNFAVSEKMKDTRVVLSYRRKRDVNITTETYRYIEVPAKVKTLTGLRGGLQYNSSILKTDGFKIAEALSDVTFAGGYAGIQLTRKHLLKLRIKGSPDEIVSGSIFRIFADALAYPISDIKNPFLDTQIKSGTFGGRVGVNWVPQPYGKKNQPAHYHPFFGRMNMALEIGSRPVEGAYFKGGLYWGLVYR